MYVSNLYHHELLAVIVRYVESSNFNDCHHLVQAVSLVAGFLQQLKIAVERLLMNRMRIHTTIDITLLAAATAYGAPDNRLSHTSLDDLVAKVSLYNR